MPTSFKLDDDRVMINKACFEHSYDLDFVL